MSEKNCRGVRGAITVAEDTPQAILAGSKELLLEITHQNGIDPEDIAAVIFSLTPDLQAAFPAAAARAMGWQHVPLFDTQEVPVPGALEKVIRVLLLWNTGLSQREIRHVYLGGAVGLRPDLKSK